MTEVVTYIEYANKGPGDILSPIPFSYLTDADGNPQVDVYADTVLADTTLYSWTGASEITLGASFPGPGAVLVRRRTPIDAVEDQQDGTAALDWELINTNFEKVFKALEEHRDILDGLEVPPFNIAALTTANLDATLASKTAVSSGNLSYLLGLYSGTVKALPVRMYRPQMHQAVGDGTTVDTAAFQALATQVRSAVIAWGYTYLPIEVNFDGGVWVLDDTIDFTGMQSWNTLFRGGVFKCKMAGKPAMNFTGSRGHTFRDMDFEGDATSEPTVPILSARASTSFAFCDNVIYDHIIVNGFWSVAAHYAYAQETTTHIHCHYWNSDPAARVAIFEGYDSHPQTAQNGKTILTGGQSFINCTYLNVDFRYAPTGSLTIVGVTKANPAVITYTGTDPTNGTAMVCAHIYAGMLQLNGKAGTVANVDTVAKTFELSGVNSTSYTTYTSGGVVKKKADNPAIYMNRMKGHRFIQCYVVAYGDHAIEFGFPDHNPLQQCTFDFLFEGAAALGAWKWTVGTSSELVEDCEFLFYALHTSAGLFYTDSSGAGQVNMYRCKAHVTDYVYGNTPFVASGQESEFAIFGLDAFWPSRTTFGPTASYAAFNGKVFCVSDGKEITYGETVWNPGIGTVYTPANNGDLVIETTSNTQLKFKLKGSDGTVRSNTLTLA